MSSMIFSLMFWDVEDLEAIWSMASKNCSLDFVYMSIGRKYAMRLPAFRIWSLTVPSVLSLGKFVKRKLKNSVELSFKSRTCCHMLRQMRARVRGS